MEEQHAPSWKDPTTSQNNFNLKKKRKTDSDTDNLLTIEVEASALAGIHATLEKLCEGWNEDALQGAFQQALTETIKDELVSKDEPDGLEELIFLAIRIDISLRECRRARARRVACPITTSASLLGPPPTASLSKSLPEPEPMWLGWARLI